MVSIPVMVDKSYPEFDMVRCTYFSVECDAPSQRETMGGIPIYMVGLTGVVWKPLGKRRLFSSPELIDELFDSIEADPALFVDINEIWLPAFLFKESNPTRGSIYRVSAELFNRAYRFAAARISKDEFVSSCKDATQKSLQYSAIETDAFSKWQRAHIEEAKKIYPKSKELRLQRKEGWHK